MKSLYLTGLLAVFTLFAAAQEETAPDPKPVEGYWGLSFDLTGLIDNIALNSIEDVNGNNSFLVRRYINDEYVFRMGFGVNSSNKDFNTVDSVANASVAVDSTFRQTNFYISPGVEKHFINNKRLDSYVGASMDFGVLGRTNATRNTTITDTTGVATINLDSQRDGGFAFGLNVMAGFNYFFSNKLAIGAEYRFGYNFVREGGDFSTFISDNPVSGSGTNQRIVGSSRESEGGLRVNSTAGITLSYFFTRNKPRG